MVALALPAPFTKKGPAMFNGPYEYLPGFTGFGIGSGSVSFQRPTTIPVDSQYGPRYNVHNTLSPQAPGYLKMGQSLVPVSLKANGVYFSGDLALQALSDFQKGLIP